ncbi:MAG: glutaredoxin family protein [Candidatus Binatia bacterium]
MARLALILYGRPGCHLCDEMKNLVRSVAPEFDAVVKEVNIAGDRDLEARFGHEIPVLFVSGRKAFKYRVTARALRGRLRAAQRRRPPIAAP